MKQIFRICVLALCVVSLLSVSGCRLFGKGKKGGGGVPMDMLDPSALGEGEMPLGPRTEFGQQVLGVEFVPVQFMYDSFQVEAGERSKIEAVADYLSQNSAMTVVVEGHCDERGSREYNMSLGERRALAVRAYLVGLGIEASRIQSLSYGEESPVDPGHSEAAWAKNRRVEFSIYK